METLLVPIFEYSPQHIIDTTKMMNEIKDAVTAGGALVYADFMNVIATWRHNVKFEHKGFMKGGDYVFQVYTDDEIMGYLNEGTNIRWATMWPKFIPKTAPRRLRSGSGRYPNPRLKGRGQHMATQPPTPAKPGIDAREFDLAIIEKNQYEIYAKLNLAVWRGLRR